MGKVKLNIVGYNYPYTMTQDYDTITLKQIYRYLIGKDILLKKLVNCKFVYGGQLLEIDKQQLDIDENINIYVVVGNEDKDFKTDLIKKLFNINLECELEDNLEEVEPEEINTELCDYFKDKDFITLLNIIKSKPQYLEMVSSYLSHGEIVDEIDFDNIEYDNFEYEKELEILNNNVKPNMTDWDEERVRKILVEYNGNVNLTSRYLLV